MYTENSVPLLFPQRSVRGQLGRLHLKLSFEDPQGRKIPSRNAYQIVNENEILTLPAEFDG
jgi:hypothetical protein